MKTTLAGLLTRRIALIVALAFAGQTALVAWEYGRDHEELARTSAEREIDEVAARVHIGGGRFAFEMPPHFEARYERFPGAYALQIVDGSGRVLLERNGALFGSQRHPVDPDLDMAWKVEPVAGGVLRLMSRRVETGPEPYLIRFAAIGDPDGLYWYVLFHETVDHVLLPLIPLSLALLVVGAAVVRRGLAPVRAVAEAAGRIDPATTRFRIDRAGLPAEVASLTEAIDRLLDRLDELAAGQAAFASSVAHELRTPLALLTLDLERLSGPEAERARADVQAMTRLVDQLLRIARLEALPIDVEARVDLAATARDVVARLAPIAIDQGREIAFVDNAPGAVVGDADTIAVALRNLIENALRVTPPGGTVVVEAGPGPELLVADEGPGLPPGDTHDLFRRYRQGDGATRGRAGLGLAIVARTMEVLGGRVTCGNGVATGAWFRLAFRSAGS